MVKMFILKEILKLKYKYIHFGDVDRGVICISWIPIFFETLVSAGNLHNTAIVLCLANDTLACLWALVTHFVRYHLLTSQLSVSNLYS